MKDTILKLAGVKSEKALYAKYGTEAAFLKAHGKELKKAMRGTNLKKAQIGENIVPFDSPDSLNPNAVVDSTGAGVSGTVNPNNPYPQFQNTKSQGTPFNPAKGIPVIGNIVGGIMANAQEKEQLHQAQQENQVTSLLAKAAGTRAQPQRKLYVRPEEQLLGAMHPEGQAGNPFLAKKGARIGGNPTEIQNTYSPNTIYNDLGFEPLSDSEIVKAYRMGGLVKAEGGFDFSSFLKSSEGDKTFGMANSTIDNAFNHNAGSQIGEGVGEAASFIPGVGPILSKALKPIGSLVGGLLDQKGNKIKSQQQQTQTNIGNLIGNQIGQGIQKTNSSYMQKGGKMTIAQLGEEETLKKRKGQTTDIPLSSISLGNKPNEWSGQTSFGETIPKGINPIAYKNALFLFKNKLDSMTEEYHPSNGSYIPQHEHSNVSADRYDKMQHYSYDPSFQPTVAKEGGWMNPEYNPQVITKFGDLTSQDYYNFAHKGIDTLRTGGQLRQNQMPMGGELQTHWGGYAEPISQNPYLPNGGQTVMFKGNSHEESDGHGHTGIGVSYGSPNKDSYTNYAEYGSNNGADVEVERNEPAFISDNNKSMSVAGALPISKLFLPVIGDDRAVGKRFKTYVANISADENKQNSLINKSTIGLNDLNTHNPIDKLTENSLIANIQGANNRLEKNAEFKKNAMALQNSINETAAEHGLVAEDLAKGDIKIDKKAMNAKAKYGLSLFKAQNGTIESNNNLDKYTNYFNNYLQRNIFKGTKLKAEDLAEPLVEFGKTHPDVNLDDLAKLMLAQGQQETHLGLKGRGGKPGENNPFDIMEYDDGTKKVFNSPKEGINFYLNTLGKDYLPSVNNNVNKLLDNYVNSKGKRYASSPNYEEQLKKTISNINTNYPLNSKNNSTIVDESILPPGHFYSRGPSGEILGEYDGNGTLVTGKSTTVPLVTTTDTTTKAIQNIVPPKPQFPWAGVASSVINQIRQPDRLKMGLEETLGEYSALANNQLEPVQAQLYHPQLESPYSISLQDIKNRNQGDFNSMERIVGNDPAALSTLSAQKYNANNAVGAEEFRQNQGIASGIYNKNIDTLNNAQQENLKLLDQQYLRESQAKSNTKATQLAALSSIGDKIAKLKRDNSILATGENTFNYRFPGDNFKAINENGPVQYNLPTVGEYASSGKATPPQGFKYTYNEDGSVADMKPIKGNTTPPLKYGSRIKARNGAIVNSFKNL